MWHILTRMNDRVDLIKKAALISIVGNALLAASKIAAGFMAGSLAVVGDGVDSSTDVFISLVSLVAAGIINKPSDREHPYGHSRAETTATTILSFVILFAGAQLFLSTVSQLSSHAVRIMPGPLALWVTGLSIVGKLLLSYSQFKLGKKTGSSMLIANGKNMRNDVLISCSVLLGLLLTWSFRCRSSIR